MISAREQACTVGGVLLFLDWALMVEDLDVSLNYGQPMGAPPLLRFVTEHTEVSGAVYG
jgi:hypothetical protein